MLFDEVAYERIDRIRELSALYEQFLTLYNDVFFHYGPKTMMSKRLGDITRALKKRRDELHKTVTVEQFSAHALNEARNKPEEAVEEKDEHDNADPDR